MPIPFAPLVSLTAADHRRLQALDRASSTPQALAPERAHPRPCPRSLLPERLPRAGTVAPPPTPHGSPSQRSPAEIIIA